MVKEMIDVDRGEVERYLGYRGTTVDCVTSEMIDCCMSELNDVAEPKYIYRQYDVAFSKPGSACEIDIGGMKTCSSNLARNLKGCTKAVLLAATLGLGPDRLIARSEITSIVKAAIYQATATAMIEAYVDGVNKEIKDKAFEQGLFARPRFSPGYGDLPLVLQKDFATMLDMPRTVGITLTESLLMKPSKSVTAIIGLSKHNSSCITEGCEVCDRRGECEFSRVTE
ncbi:MAG: Vitamin B12 dependent methionine synthase activation subunit [Clostridiales bacterium]|jgi:hypothetical protein|nr:Vitamin B12 dependent methionine synthase activation subunit [Clostridiales bacterium]